MRHLCTYFDKNFLVPGLTLYRSLAKTNTEFQLYVLCFDEYTAEFLRSLRLSNLIVIPQKEFEQNDEALWTAKGNRSLIEYYFTCSPSLPLYILKKWPSIESIAYVDADLFFFNSPEPIFQEFADRSILICEHRFPDSLKSLEEWGKYNVGLIIFRNDANARDCLQWWRDRCNEWCYDRLEDGKFADQKYLDDWPQRFNGAAVLQHKGAGLAPWNLGNYTLDLNHQPITVDEAPLIFYHYHGLKVLNRWMCDPKLHPFGLTIDSAARWLYRRYMREMRETCRWAALPSQCMYVRKKNIRFHSLRILEIFKMIFTGRILFVR
ncbi:MAG: hypothetical protein AB1656_19695 [Candidatus Omnitrophota bacterium]